MKVEINLNDILGDEFGAETLQESVRRQVIENLTKVVKEGVGKKVEAEVSKVINEEIRNAVTAQMPALIEDLMSAEFVQVDRYGDRQREKTTFRKELVKAINEQMEYKQARYSSDKNAFTKAVDEVIEHNLDSFKSAFSKQVESAFVKDALDYATKKLGERLGVKAA